MSKSFDDLSIIPGRKESSDVFQKIRKAGTILRQILHSRECKGACLEQSCICTHHILEHLQSGCNTTVCHVAGCNTTRKLIAHYNSCCRESIKPSHFKQSISFCLICSYASATPNLQRKSRSEPSLSSKLRVHDTKMDMSLREKLDEENLAGCEKRLRCRSKSADLSAMSVANRDVDHDAARKRSRYSIHADSPDGSDSERISCSSCDDSFFLTSPSEITFRDPSFENYRVSWA